MSYIGTQAENPNYFANEPTSIELEGGTYNTDRLYRSSTATVTGDITLTNNLVLARITDKGNNVTLTSDGVANRVITGSGKIESGNIVTTNPGNFTGMTGTIGSAVQDNITRLGTIASADLTSYILKAQFVHSSSYGWADEEQYKMTVTGDVTQFVPDSTQSQFIKIITSGLYFISASIVGQLTSGDEELIRGRIWKTPNASVTDRAVLAQGADQVTTPESGTAYGESSVFWVGNLTANEHIYFAIDSGAGANVVASSYTHASIIGFPS